MLSERQGHERQRKAEDLGDRTTNRNVRSWIHETVLMSYITVYGNKEINTDATLLLRQQTSLNSQQASHEPVPVSGPVQDPT